MDGISPSHQNPDSPDNRYEKTIDESAMGMSQSPGTQPGTSDTRIINKAFAPNTLPTGNESIKLGSGKIVGVLGAGGMAKVYKIWNEKLEVHRAVKILLPGSQKDLSNRFETEAKITAKLHHPNIVEIYNVGEWNGLPYLEMEIIEGFTLDSVIGARGKLPDIVVCAIGIQIARALSYAHNQDFLIYGKTYNGIIHRDLKPANIMISQQGNIKLMDFGIARPTEVGLHTMEGHIVGTLQYLSPEQLDGVAIDNRSDIYSFGAIIYEMLTGTKTFPQATITNLMRMKATNDYRKFNEFDFSINAALGKIAEKCLQQKRDSRFENANLLLKALTKAYNSFSSSTPEETLQEFIKNPDSFAVSGTSKKIVKKSLMYAAIVLVFLGAVGGGIYYLLQNPPQVQNRQTTQTATAPAPRTEPAPARQTVLDTVSKAAQVAAPADEGQLRASVTQKPPKTVSPKKIEPSPRKDQIGAVSPSSVKTSPLETLKKKYGLSDPVEIGAAACNDAKFTDAITALVEVTPNHPAFTRRNQYLLWAFVETRNLNGAREISASVLKNDAFILLLLGRMEEGNGNDKKAIDYYDAALTKPSNIRGINEIRNDALYYTALVYDKYFIKSPSAETRFKAVTAWNNVKRVYTANTDHPRFKMANKKLSEY